MATDPEIDRKTTVPFHLKVFYRTGGFHRLEDYHSTTYQASTPSTPSHFDINTWFDCTLRELSHHVVANIPHLLPSPPIGTRLNFRLVFPDNRSSRPSSRGAGRYMSKLLGTVVIGSGPSSSNNENVNPNSTYYDGPGTLTSAQKEIVGGGLLSSNHVGTPEKSLQDAKFVIGDYLECAIILPLPNGDIAPFPEVPMNSHTTNPTPVYSLEGAGGVRGSMRNGAGGGGGANDFIHPSRAGRIEGATGWRSGQGDFGGGRVGVLGPRENGFGGFGANGGGGGFRGGARGGGNTAGYGRDDVPTGEWRRGERLPDGPPMRGGNSYGYGRGRGGRRW